MRQRTYDSDLSNREWNLLNPHLPKPSRRGRPRKVKIRAVVDAIFYILKTGSQWRMCPKSFPPWRTVYGYYKQWKENGIISTINKVLREQVRTSVGRLPQPSAGIIDSQTVKGTEESMVSGYDGGKKIKGIKRHIVVDVLGLILDVSVHTAAISDRDGAKELLTKIVDSNFERLALVWADGGYSGTLVDWVREKLLLTLDIVRRKPGGGFQILPWRWIVERTFGWLNRYRRLSRSFERKTDSCEAWIYLAMIRLMLRRLA